VQNHTNHAPFDYYQISLKLQKNNFNHKICLMSNTDGLPKTM